MTCVTQMFSCDSGMLVYVQIGVIFIFPPASKMPQISRWKNSRAIVVNNFFKLYYIKNY